MQPKYPFTWPFLCLYFTWHCWPHSLLYKCWVRCVFWVFPRHTVLIPILELCILIYNCQLSRLLSPSRLKSQTLSLFHHCTHYRVQFNDCLFKVSCNLYCIECVLSGSVESKRGSAQKVKREVIETGWKVLTMGCVHWLSSWTTRWKVPFTAV